MSTASGAVKPEDVDLRELAGRLAELGFAPVDGESGLRLIGEGWWSTCFAFDSAVEPSSEPSNAAHSRGELVVRVGRDDRYFAKDRVVSDLAVPGLRAPQVHAIESFGDGCVAVSDRVNGSPLELLAPDQFRSVIPSLVGVFAALQGTEPAGPGWGEWDRTGQGPHESWREHLYSAFLGTPDGFRRHDWRNHLANDRLSRVVDAAESRLAALDLTGVTRSIYHGDLLHRNVHVLDGQIGGVFDWGAAGFGDHLYELACFDFWQPWHPALDFSAVRAALFSNWEAEGSLAPNHANRLAACHIHIGVAHIAFTAVRLDRQVDADQIADQLEALVDL